jgi:imidazolonepropionase-like amidohydrolase
MKNPPGTWPVITVWLALLASPPAFSQTRQDTLSKGTFILHKFQQPIGKEFYSIVKSKDSLRIYSDFKFNDRGTDVPLQTLLVTNQKGEPGYFKIKGSTSRTSAVDAEVLMDKGKAFVRVNKDMSSTTIVSPSFTISGYSPVVVQMLMIKYWKEHGKPESLLVYPKGSVKIKFAGLDSVLKGKTKINLERYFISGLIWGNEIVWTEESGQLAALFTNDAEGDKFEAIEKSYLTLLPSLISKAATYGMANFVVKESVPAKEKLAITNANIVDVLTGAVIRNGVILIDKGIIQVVGNANAVEIPNDVHLIDAAGQYVLPGLWDMHAHFQQVEWGPAYLAAGVTTVRDCGNEFDFINAVKDAIDKNSGVGPHIIKAGIIDGDSPMALGIVRVNNEKEAGDIVKRYKDNGYEQIKIYSSVKPEMIKAIAREAHAVGLPVTGHIPRGVSPLEAVALGQDQINHFSFLYRSMVSGPDQKKIDFTDSIASNTLRILKEKNVVVDPTLGVYEWITRSVDDPMDSFEPGVNFMTEDLKEIFRNTGLPAEEAAKSKYFLESGKELVLALHKMGITIVAGTDMMVPGFSLYREIELYNEAGLTTLEAIQTATIVPARVMKKDQVSGSIEAGKNADLIIVQGNPLDNISNVRNVKVVVKGGRVYDPGEVRGMVGFKR